MSKELRMKYLNTNSIAFAPKGTSKTVAENESLQKSQELLEYYTKAYPNGDWWISQRASKDWKWVRKDPSIVNALK